VPISVTVPGLLHLRGYSFWFGSADGGEPPHVHVAGNGGRAKIWLMPTVRWAKRGHYDRRHLEEIERIVGANRASWLEAWNAFFHR
jgi:hypothetical protein